LHWEGKHIIAREGSTDDLSNLAINDFARDACSKATYLITTLFSSNRTHIHGRRLFVQLTPHNIKINFNFNSRLDKLQQQGEAARNPLHNPTHKTIRK
jgi:hypothetical protein